MTGIRYWSRFIALSLIALYCFAGIPAESYGRKEAMEKRKKLRPPELLTLLIKPHAGGDYLLGMYEVEKGESDKSLRRFKLWQEWPYELKVHTESVRCNHETPLRVKRDSIAIYVRRLNPGGEITQFNREDHLVWWAACFPEMAGVDPATLGNKARALGYSTNLIENQEILKLP